MKLFNGKSIMGFTSGLALSVLVLFPPGSTARAQAVQDAPPRPEGAAPPAGPRDEISLLRLLNLTPEQIEQLRAIRQQSDLEGRPLMRRLNQARRALDEAIYADDLDENLIRERASEVAAAQAALFRLRTQAELRVRRVLTAEQLQRFRDLRREAQAQQRIQRQLQRRDQQRPQGEGFNNRPNRRLAPPTGNDNTRRPAPTRQERRRLLNRP